MKTESLNISTIAILMIGLFFQGCTSSRLSRESSNDLQNQEIIEVSSSEQFEIIKKGTKIRLETEERKVIIGEFDSLLTMEKEGTQSKLVIIRQAGKKVFVNAEKIVDGYTPPEVKKNRVAAEIIEILIGTLLALGVIIAI